MKTKLSVSIKAAGITIFLLSVISAWWDCKCNSSKMDFCEIILQSLQILKWESILLYLLVEQTWPTLYIFVVWMKCSPLLMLLKKEILKNTFLLKTFGIFLLASPGLLSKMLNCCQTYLYSTYFRFHTTPFLFICDWPSFLWVN